MRTQREAIVLRLEQCGVMPEQLDAYFLRTNTATNICGLEVLCRKFDVPSIGNALTAEAVRSDRSFERHRNWRIVATGAEFSICDITVQTFPVPHDAVDPRVRFLRPAQVAWALSPISGTRPR